jgi:hypothetical protein
MKGKLLLGFTLISIANSSGYAMEIVKGKLLSHKETTTGEAKFVVKDIKLDMNKRLNKLKAKKLFVQDNKYDFISIINHAYPAFGVVGDGVIVSGNADIAIDNNTFTTHTYTASTILCSMVSAEMNICGFATDKFQLDPGGHAYSNRMPSLTMTYNTPDIYDTFVSSNVVRDDGETQFASYDMNSVEIADAE